MGVTFKALLTVFLRNKWDNVILFFNITVDPQDRKSLRLLSDHLPSCPLMPCATSSRKQRGPKRQEGPLIGRTWVQTPTFHSFAVWTLFNFSVISFFICKKVRDTWKPTAQSSCKISATVVKLQSRCLLAYGRCWSNTFEVPLRAFFPSVLLFCTTVCRCWVLLIKSNSLWIERDKEPSLAAWMFWRNTSPFARITMLFFFFKWVGDKI